MWGPNIPDRFGGIDYFVSTGEIIRNGFSLFIVNTVDLLQPRVCDLFCGLRNLDFGNKLPVFLDSREFINSAEHRVGSRGNKPLPNTEAVNLSSLMDQGTDSIFVKAVGSNDNAVFQTCFIEHFS